MSKNFLSTPSPLTPGHLTLATGPFTECSSHIGIKDRNSLTGVSKICGSNAEIDLTSGTLRGFTVAEQHSPLPQNVVTTTNASTSLSPSRLSMATGQFTEASTGIVVTDNNTGLSNVSRIVNGDKEIDLVNGKLVNFSLDSKCKTAALPSNNVTTTDTRTPFVPGKILVATGPFTEASSDIGVENGSVLSNVSAITSNNGKSIDFVTGKLTGFDLGDAAVPENNVTTTNLNDQLIPNRLSMATGPYTETSTGIGSLTGTDLTNISSLSGNNRTIDFVSGTMTGFKITEPLQNIITTPTPGSVLHKGTLPVCAGYRTIRSSDIRVEGNKLLDVDGIEGTNASIDLVNGTLTGFDMMTPDIPPNTLVAHTKLTPNVLVIATDAFAVGDSGISVTGENKTELQGISSASGKTVRIDFDTGTLSGLKGIQPAQDVVYAKPQPLTPNTLTMASDATRIQSTQIVVNGSSELKGITKLSSVDDNVFIDFVSRTISGFTGVPYVDDFTVPEKEKSDIVPLPPNVITTTSPHRSLLDGTLLRTSGSFTVESTGITVTKGTEFGNLDRISGSNGCVIDFANRSLIGFGSGPSQMISNANPHLDYPKLLNPVTNQLVNIIGGRFISVDSTTVPGALVINWNDPGKTGGITSANVGVPLLRDNVVWGLKAGQGISLDSTSYPGAIVINAFTDVCSGKPIIKTSSSGVPIYDPGTNTMSGLVAGTNIDIVSEPGHLVINNTLTQSPVGIPLFENGVVSGLVAGPGIRLDTSIPHTIKISCVAGEDGTVAVKNSGEGFPLLDEVTGEVYGIEPGPGMSVTRLNGKLVISTTTTSGQGKSSGNVYVNDVLKPYNLVVGDNGTTVKTSDISALFNPVTNSLDGLAVSMLVMNSYCPDGTVVTERVFPQDTFSVKATGLQQARPTPLTISETYTGKWMCEYLESVSDDGDLLRVKYKGPNKARMLVWATGIAATWEDDGECGTFGLFKYGDGDKTLIEAVNSTMFMRARHTRMPADWNGYDTHPCDLGGIGLQSIELSPGECIGLALYVTDGSSSAPIYTYNAQLCVQIMNTDYE